MVCGYCSGEEPRLGAGDCVQWLDYCARVYGLPEGTMHAQELSAYRLLIDSGLAWKVDHIDGYGGVWLCLQRQNRDGESYQTVRLSPGTYRRIPCCPVYPVVRLAASPVDSDNC